MHLQILENYIAELLKARIDNRHEFLETSQVISRLMDIIIEEEKRIPDFVVNGDTYYRDDSAHAEFDDSDDDDDGFFWPDNEIDGDLLSLEQPVDSDSDGYIDPGFIFPVGGGYFVSVRSIKREKDRAMRRLKWMSIMMFVAAVSFVVGLLAAP